MTERRRKPDTRTAMAELIAEARRLFPIDAPETQVCGDDCRGCSLKLLEFLDSELLDWEARLAAGEVPNFGDLQRLGQTCRKLYRVLDRNGLVEPMTDQGD